MSRKLIVFDIDGTLVNDDHELLEETLAAIASLKKAGHMVMCATGRSLPIAKEVLEAAEIEHSILSNGSVAFVDGQQIYGNALNQNSLSEFIALSDKENIDLVFHGLTETKMRNEDIQVETKLAMESFGENLPEVEADFHQKNDVYQVVALLPESKMFIYHDKFPDFRFVRWHEYGIDVLPQNGSKAETLKFVAEKYGFNREDIVAFGDGNNDMEMIAYAGIGVVMENAQPELKKIADFITLSNNDGGICHGLREYGLI